MVLKNPREKANEYSMLQRYVDISLKLFPKVKKQITDFEQYLISKGHHLNEKSARNLLNDITDLVESIKKSEQHQKIIESRLSELENAVEESDLIINDLGYLELYLDALIKITFSKVDPIETSKLINSAITKINNLEKDIDRLIEKEKRLLAA